MSRDEAKCYIGETPSWKLAAEGTRITRIFRFRDFKEALRFVDKVGAVAKGAASGRWQRTRKTDQAPFTCAAVVGGLDPIARITAR
jgi:hypothetical protein